AAEFNDSAGIVADPIVAYMGKGDIDNAIELLKRKMIDAAKRMDFLEAAQYRDEIVKLTEKLSDKERTT
ncbi:MAG: UvrB/UvrC motif-containing protein, partial [Bacteroidales bacterium]|nr:UvrB/UvrC motif-containing protein [Candidatus Sodaliphilus fimicaballi]